MLKNTEVSFLVYKKSEASALHPYFRTEKKTAKCSRYPIGNPIPLIPRSTRHSRPLQVYATLHSRLFGAYPFPLARRHFKTNSERKRKRERVRERERGRDIQADPYAADKMRNAENSPEKKNDPSKEVNFNGEIPTH